jgi:threonine/homoserine/homoserine lactone efflux protein
MWIFKTAYIYRSEEPVGIKKGFEASAGYSAGAATILVFGILLLVAGIFIYLYTQPEIEKLESWLGGLRRVLSSDLKNKYEILKLLNIASIISIVVGGILAILGLLLAAVGTVKRQ